jgi:NSS family neurotransmitter:Na+ symporter
MTAPASASSSRGSFGSRVGFILAAAGSAIGLGNIWRFPYAAGENGGAAFVLVYLAFVFLCGIPVLLAELALGRQTKANPVGAFEKIAPGSKWKLVGALGVVTGFCILAFYSVVAGWTLSYLGRALVGTFGGAFDAAQSKALFETIISDPRECIATTVVFLVLTGLVVRGGIGGGIERWSKILMPMLFAILIVLAIRSLTLPGAGEGLRFLFHFDPSELSGKAAMSALGQALFSLSLGMGGMITYGSYLAKRENLAVAGVAVAIADTSVAVLAGLIVFPALFSTGHEPSAGPGLVFQVLPGIFHTLPLGNLFAIAFYALLAIAALTSTISLLEVVVAYFVDERGWTREKAVWTIVVAAAVVAVPSALSQGASDTFSSFVAGQSFLDIQNIVWGNLSLSFGALFIAVFVAYRWGIDRAERELATGRAGGVDWFMRAWSLLLRFVCPILIGGVFVYLIVTGEFL